jgi:hypothetical protein
MNLFCSEKDLANESDVEQKVVFPLLHQLPPRGLGFQIADIKTKPDIRKFQIDKGTSKKMYYPDYVIVMSGLPVLAVEVKGPDEDIETARREARLYATELNSLFPAFENPCRYTLVSTGKITSVQSWDSDRPLASFSLDQADPSDINFSQLASILQRNVLQDIVYKMLRALNERQFYRPVNLVGGRSVRDEEIAPNTFGSTLAFKFKHIFNPLTRHERAFIVQNAYIPSTRRDRYLQQIDRIIRAAAPPSISHARAIEDTAKPTEILARFESLKHLEHQVLLLIGSVGAGKSTFVDYLKEVALPTSLKDHTAWVHLDLNAAPLSKESVYQWVTEELRLRMPLVEPDIDFDSNEILQKLYAPELQKLRKGPLAHLAPTSTEHLSRIADEIIRLQSDALKTIKAMERFLCTERAKLLVVVLDNCDKRGRDEQLLMFQVAQWLQSTLRCLIILPLRDVTYDNHRHEPPLDTALKDLVFRIEPPNFQRVLHSRVQLALREMQKDEPSKMLSYTLGNGIKVEYPSSKLGVFLASIMRSIYDHDAFIRRMVTGIAGRDIRRAIEIFLEFCTSGHIDEAQILKITTMEGQHALPYFTVANILLRMNKRFYDGDESYVKNLFQCEPSDPKPDHFIRLYILDWLRSKMSVRGPNGTRGYHRTETLLGALTAIGADSGRALEEILYLIKASCIIPEHQRSDNISPEDLISISPAGYVHLDLTNDVNYLAACAEDLWYSKEDFASAISTRIGDKFDHFTRRTTLNNAGEITTYLKEVSGSGVANPSLFLVTGALQSTFDFNKQLAYIDQQLDKLKY